MLKLLNIQVEGFCSIVEPQSMHLDLGGTILMKAPNGFGKSTLFSAITWALYGKHPKGKVSVNTWKKLQPSGYKGTKVVVTWESDKGVFQVTRCQKYTGKLEDGSKGGDRVILVRDGEAVKIKGKLKIQRAINQVLGFSYELFVSSIMFGQGMKRLIQEDNSDKKKIFEEIFNLEYLTVARSIAQEERSQINEEYRDLEHRASAYEREIAMLQKTYKELKAKEDTWKYTNDRAISRQETQLKRVKKEIEKLSEKLNSQEDYKEVYNQCKQDIEDTEYLLEQAEQVQDVPLLDLVNKTVKLLEANKLSKALNTLKRIQAAWVRSNDLRKTLKEERHKLDEAREKYREQERQDDHLEELQSRAREIRKEIKDLKNTHIRETSHKYIKKIDKAKQKLTTLEEQKNFLETKLEDYNWVLSDPLSNNGIKAFLFDSSLQALNDNLDRYAEVLGFRIQFEVDLNSARKEFVTLIEKDGIICDYNELSGGEQGLVNLTMCLALHETLTLSKDVNLLLLDEVFEHLDKDNIELVISLIRVLSEGKTVFLISHIENLPFGNCKVLEVCKNNGQTHYSHL